MGNMFTVNVLFLSCNGIPGTSLPHIKKKKQRKSRDSKRDADQIVKTKAVNEERVGRCRFNLYLYYYPCSLLTKIINLYGLRLSFLRNNYEDINTKETHMKNN